ncbi:GNAT family N-acetyltransferase [Jatrophihabitans sp.]|uniref:GNAT family N-acetyltransferase n=1 Tax=Jatrophihabitans sp. TaxID=1932789 RepID=UPI002C5A22FE|nr:GNAT family protein [Jatrophihabitans sp.]
MLVGKLVTLRALTDADMRRLTEFRNDAELELIGGGDPPRPRTLEVVREFFAERAKDTEGQNFAIEADGKFIGDCGVFHPDRRGGTAEVGIGIGDRDYWGRGYGRDAMRLLVDYGFRLQNFRRLWLSVQARNERAIRCYRSVGFVEEGRLREHVWGDGRYEDIVLMALFRSDFYATKATSSAGG